MSIVTKLENEIQEAKLLGSGGLVSSPSYCTPEKRRSGLRPVVGSGLECCLVGSCPPARSKMGGDLGVSAMLALL